MTIAPSNTDVTVSDQAQDTPVTAELLIEEVSIDGMCGVY